MCFMVVFSLTHDERSLDHRPVETTISSTIRREARLGTKLDALLGRKGEIAAAAGAIYRRVLARDPEFRDKIIAAGRDREISAAYRETA